jgi:hypothetical protein
MAFGYIAAAVLAAAVTLFAIQNSAPTAVHFLAWKREGMPVSALILVSWRGLCAGRCPWPSRSGGCARVRPGSG